MPDFKIIRDSTPPSDILKGAVVAMGNFDGVHLGHRAVIEAAIEMGKAKAALLQPQYPAVPPDRRDRQAAAPGRNRSGRRRGHDLRQGSRPDPGAGFHSP
jgi:hypothetical protein